MDVRIQPRRLSGAVTPPPSKSMAHRLVIAASLAAGESAVRNVDFSADIEATVRCMEALGAKWETEGDGLRITGIGGLRQPFGDLPRFDCGESGSTLRFLIPIALAADRGGVFTGRGRLMERPQQPYFDLFRERGIQYAREGDTLTVRGQLTPGVYRLPGNVSSQFFTGLLLALPLLEEPSTVVSTTRLESGEYVAMTMLVLDQAQVPVKYLPGDRAFRVSPAIYHPFDLTVEADWSQAAFWLAAVSLGSGVEIAGLDRASTQGDRVIEEFFSRLSWPGDGEIDVSGCPDLAPPLAVMAAGRRGVTGGHRGGAGRAGGGCGGGGGPSDHPRQGRAGRRLRGGRGERSVLRSELLPARLRDSQ